ncbi:DNA gyrase/topoisomerase IV subunit A [Lachnospira multipara]|uniref:DNA gyrase/topoisomerase IV subunit A n=1 Tax=Lachnospira multipara TaxID=28051 RepID=UPI0004E27329|nr:DNA topoisomerase (ATP-hydrolyzing) [Lachnospira multipara]
MAEQIVKTEFSEIMQKSYIDYSMSVITARALPDARDGLKPVQRRVLYAMDQLNLGHDKPHRKSARIVGDTMGKYHPHGDSSIYETLVVLSQDFKKGMALVDGHGNFGSIEGDGAAAMRYTEARLKKFTEDVYLSDLDKNVVDFVPNFDETEKEPEVLPVRVPNLLINGADGIAVGMTTNIPPHNLREVVAAVCAYMDNEDIETSDLLEIMPGPDFPTGGIVINKSELLNIYETGQGKIKLRGKVVYEPAKKRSERDKLVITEIPYTMIGANISKFISDVVDLIETKKTSDIVDISNESSKEGIRIVLELKKNADYKNLENMLYKKTKLEDTFGVNMLAIVNGRPETLSLKQLIKHHVDFQFELATRKYTTLLNKEKDNKEIKEGLIKACDIIDLIIEILRGSKNLKMAKDCLVNGNVEDINFKTEKSRKEASKLRFTERQATEILQMRLYKLIGLEILQLQKEYEECLKKIAKYEKILSSKKEMAKVIKADLVSISKEYGIDRKTEILDAEVAVFKEKEIEEKPVVFIMDRFGYAKTIDVSAYERNKEAVHAENKYVFTCMNTGKILIFTDTGNLHQIKVLDLPYTRFRDKGTPIDNVGNYDSSGENIVFIGSESNIKNKKLLFVTKMGMMKLVDSTEFEANKKTVMATKLNEDDLVVSVSLTDAKIEKYSKFTLDGEIVEEESIESNLNVVLATKGGIFLKFPLTEVPEKKKNAIGVRGIKLAKDDTVLDVYLYGDGDDVTVDYKKKTVDLSKMKMAHRDTKGTKVKL